MKDNSDYQVQKENNEKQALTFLRSIFPNSSDEVLISAMTIVSALDSTNVNPQIIPFAINGIARVTNSTGEGEVILHVSKGKTTIEARQRTPERLETLLSWSAKDLGLITGSAIYVERNDVAV